MDFTNNAQSANDMLHGMKFAQYSQYKYLFISLNNFGHLLDLKLILNHDVWRCRLASESAQRRRLVSALSTTEYYQPFDRNIIFRNVT